MLRDFLVQKLFGANKSVGAKRMLGIKIVLVPKHLALGTLCNHKSMILPKSPNLLKITKDLLLISKVPTIYSKFTFYIPYAPLCGANSKFIVNFE